MSLKPANVNQNNNTSANTLSTTPQKTSKRSISKDNSMSKSATLTVLSVSQNEQPQLNNSSSSSNSHYSSTSSSCSPSTINQNTPSATSPSLNTIVNSVSSTSTNTLTNVQSTTTITSNQTHELQQQQQQQHQSYTNEEQQHSTLATNDESRNTSHTNPNNEKIYEMNTYVQLEIDSNNSLCIPRTCRFTIKTLVLKLDVLQQLLQTSTSSSLSTGTTSNTLTVPSQSQYQNPSQQQSSNPQHNSLIIAIKLDVSKRTLRTIEIPMQKILKQASTVINQDKLVLNLNLFYHITYSHYLKKQTNFLYIYIQRRKKYKNRTILGYKTLAFAKIDLQQVIQRTFNIDLLLEKINQTGSGSGGNMSTSSTLPSLSSSSAATIPITTISGVVGGTLATANDNVFTGTASSSIHSTVSSKYTNSTMFTINTAQNYELSQLQKQYGSQICGYLSIQSLSSQAFEYSMDLDGHLSENISGRRLNKYDLDDSDAYMDNYDDNPAYTMSSNVNPNGASVPTTTIIATNSNPLSNVLASLSKNKAINTALNTIANRVNNSNNNPSLTTTTTANSDSDIEFESAAAAGGGSSNVSGSNLLKLKRGSNKRSTLLSNNSAITSSTNTGGSTSGGNKKFTGKLISFIRKLRINDNDDVTTHTHGACNQHANNSNLPVIESNNSANLSQNFIYNDNDEQISDFSDTNNSIGSASDIDADLYSIVSTPKPSLQPFFKPLTTSDLGNSMSTIGKSSLLKASNNNEGVNVNNNVNADNNNNNADAANNSKTTTEETIITTIPKAKLINEIVYNLSDEDDTLHNYNLKLDYIVDDHEAVDSSSQQQSPLKQIKQQAAIMINVEQIMKKLDELYQQAYQATSVSSNISPIESVFYLICDNTMLSTINSTNNGVNLYTKLKDYLSNCYLFSLNELQQTQQRDLKLLIETLINWLNQNKQQLVLLLNKQRFQQQQYHSQHHHHQQQQQQQQIINIKLVLFGNDQFINQFLQVYVELFKTNDLLNIFKIFFIPYTATGSTATPTNVTTLQQQQAISSSNSSFIAKYLCQLDTYYQNLFGDDFWLQMDNTNLNFYNCKEIIQRIQQFIKYASHTCIQLNICEAMINIKQQQMSGGAVHAAIGGPTSSSNEGVKGVNSENEGNFDDDTSLSLPPLFIPFICDIKIIGATTTTISNNTSASNNEQSIEHDKQQPGSPTHASVSHNLSSTSRDDNISPPSTPNQQFHPQHHHNHHSHHDEYLGDYYLQIDYWTQSSNELNTNIQSTSSITGQQSQTQQQQQQQLQQQQQQLQVKDTTSSFSSSSKIIKSTTKGLFKYLHIYRMPPVQLINSSFTSSATTSNLNNLLVNSDSFNMNISAISSSNSNANTNNLNVYQYGQEPSNVSTSQNLSMIYIIKEKKQKIMRLGKKSKDQDHKKEIIDGLTRLVCTSRTQNVPLKVFIDGIEWRNIKFFQISSQWQGHIKHLNLMFGSSNKNFIQSNTVNFDLTE